MSGSGQQTHIGIAKEDIWGTAVPATDYLKFSSETLGLDPEELVSTSIPVLRDEPDSYEGLGSIGGGVVHEVHPKLIGFLLRAWYGKIFTSNPTGTVYKHIFTPGKDKEASGTAETGSSTTTLKDSDVMTYDKRFNGCWVHMLSGDNQGTWRYITLTQGDPHYKITFSAMDNAVAVGDTYEIRNGPADCVVPPYTLEVDRDLVKAWQFKGCALNNLALSFGVASKILLAIPLWIAKDYALIDPTAPDLEAEEPFRWNQAILLIGRDYSRAVDVNGNTNTTTKLYDVTASYTVDGLIGKYIRITSGTCQDQIRKITDNTATTITWSPAMSAATLNADTYEVWTEDGLMESLVFTLLSGLIGVPLLNNTKRIAKIVGDLYRSGSVSATFHVEDRTNWETYFAAWTTRPWLVLFRGASRTSTAFYYELQFHFPKVLFTAYPLNTAGPGRITVGATAKIKYDSTSEYGSKAILFNKTSTYT